MFSGKHDLQIIDGKVFLDREPIVFGKVLEYLRNNRLKLPEFKNKEDKMAFLKELEFWGLKPDNQ